MAFLNVLNNGEFKPMASEAYVDGAINSAMQSAEVPSYYGYVNKPYDFNNKTGFFFGDSICEGHTGSGVTQNNYVKLFSDHVGMTGSNKGVGGSCFSHIYNNIPTIVTKIKDTDLTNADFVFIEGGINDWQTNATATELETALNELGTYLNANYDKPVFLITPISTTRFSESHPMTIPQVRKIMSKIAVKYGFNLILGEQFNFPKEAGELATLLYGDGLHPSEAGYKLYAKCLANAVK